MTVTSKDGTTIAYETLGSGPGLILIDGAMCHRSFGPMRGLAEELQGDFTVCIYDRRGRGESSDANEYAADREVEDIAALGESLGDSYYAFGLSSGGALAFDAAVAGLPVVKVAAYEPPFFPPDNEYTKKLHALLAEGNRGDAVALFMARVGMPPQAIEGTRNSPAWPMFESIAPTLAYDDAIMERWFPVSDRAAQVDKQALVMDGEASADFFRNAVKSAADALPNARYQSLQGQTHEVDAKILADVLKDFYLS